MPRKTKEGANAPDELAEKKRQLLELTGAFCRAYLNADYEHLCKKMIEKMAKMRPAPFLRGRLEIWAAGIVHALGSANFLFDKSVDPYISATDLAAHFQASPASVSQKAGTIRKALGLSPFNFEYMTQGMQDKMAPTFEVMGEMEQLLGLDIAQIFGGGIKSRGNASDSREHGQFIARDSAVQEDFYDLTERYERQGATPAIVQSLRKLIERDPDFYDSYLILRDILLEKGQIAEGEALLEAAYQRALARITDAKGSWPAALEWGWLENRHIIRTLLNKALAEWTAGRTDAALDLLRKLLRSNPNDNIGAREYILAIHLGMTFEGFEAKFMAQFGYDAMEMGAWFDDNIARFPEEFDWWKEAVGYDEE